MTWLELLLSDASSAALRDHLQSLREAATSDVERDRAEADAASALSLRTLLVELRQRADEVSALNHIAGRLTTLRDVNALLQEIVCQAHDLLRVDMAFLALVSQDHDEMVILVTDGGLAARLRGLSFSVNAGIAGRVFETSAPQWTSDYLSASEILHIEEADVAMTSEHIGSLLGVPLKVRDDVIGVLLVGVRNRRPFADRQVTLLTSLASHAAIAIENARLFEESRCAVAETETVNRQLVEQVQAVHRAATLHERLTEIRLAGGGVDEVVTGVAEATGGKVVFVEHPAARRRADGRFSAVDAVDTDQVDLLSPAAVAELFAVPEQRRTEELRLGDGSHAAVSPILSGEEYLGALVRLADCPASDSDVRQLERGALVTALVLMTDRAIGEAEMRRHGDMFGELLTYRHDSDQRTLVRRARQAAIDLTAPQCVVVFAATSGHEAATRALARDLGRDYGGIAGEHGGYGVVLVPNRTTEGLIGEVRRFLGPSLATRATVGVAGPVVGQEELAEAFAEACRVINVLIALNRQGDAATPEELGVYRFLLSTSGRSEASQLIARTIGPLEEHDGLRGTQLTATVEAFLANDRRHAATAKQLHIHANTLYQRLDRVAAVIGNQWRSADRGLELQLAFRLARLLKALDADR